MDPRITAARSSLIVGCLALLLPLAVAAADYRPGQIVLVKRYGKLEEVRVVRQDSHGVLVQYKDWQDHTFHEDLATAPTAYYQPEEVQESQPARPQAPPRNAPPRAEGFKPGDIVMVRHNGKVEEARVVRQDEHGVLVQWKDWQDGTFHDDPATAPTEYRQPEELTPRGATPQTAPQPRPGKNDPPGGNDATAPHTPPPPPPPARSVDNAPAPPLPPDPDPGGTTAVALPDGEYYCYTYNPAPVVAGVFTITGSSYRTRTGASGRYRMSGGGRVDWLGTPPLGFRAGVLEETDPKPKIRMYPQASDIGNKWKAAVCLPKDGATAQPTGGDAKGTNAPGGKFPPGTKVWYSFVGHWYKGTIVSCSGSKCVLHYDDPKYQDETVDASELQIR